MSDRAESIANALGAAKKTPGGYICRCPCHDDRAASLSLTVGPKGGIVLNCFAGCKWQDIKAEIIRLGLIDKPTPDNGASNAPVRKDKYAGAKFYVYKDIVGNTLCRKVKLPDKKMWFERLDGSGVGAKWIPGLAGMVVPLYNLQAVLAADLVYLCEGEKDAETLIERGLIATTNHAGAKSWASHLTDQLKGKSIIIIPDNDDAGKKRVQILAKNLQPVAKELRVFMPDGVPEHGDITDWVNKGGNVNEIFEKSTAIQSKTPAKKAPREDYYALFDRVWNNPRKCIFDHKLMYWDAQEQLWHPCINQLEIVQSEAIVENEEKGREAKFVVNHIEKHFRVYEAGHEPELLVDIPDWDGEDRISAMAYLVKLNQDAGITETAWSELLKEWCALCFERLYNPKIQNRILILQGPQGIGKDTWTDMLLDGLGQYCVPLSVVGSDKDTFLSLHDGLVMKISEFDKTSKTEVSTLKDLITAPKTKLRGAYERDRKTRHSRCSFISSANVKDILRDSTGNRRYLIIEVEAIQYAYEGWSDEKIHAWQMQCLAEMKHLAECHYRASVESSRQMRDYLEGKTPSDLADDAIEVFVKRYRESGMLGSGDIEVSPNDSKVLEIIAAIAKDFGVKPRTIRALITNQLLVQRRIGGTRFRVLRVPGAVDREQKAQESQSAEADPLQF